MTTAGPVYTLCENLLTQIAADAAINAYVLAQFSVAKPKLYLGIDKKQPPDESNCPWVGVMPGGGGIDETQWNYTGHDIAVAVVIKDTTTDTATSNTTKYIGFKKCDALARLVVDRINTYFGGTLAEHRNVRLECEFPFYRATWNCRVATDA